MPHIGYMAASGVSTLICVACLSLAAAQIYQATTTQPGNSADATDNLLVAETIPEGLRRKLEELEQTNNGVVDFVKFRTATIEENLDVETGSRFEDAASLLDGRPAREWCVIKRRSRDGFWQQVLVASRDEDGPIRTVDVTHEQASSFGLTVPAAHALRQHCRFIGGGRASPKPDGQEA